MNEDTEGEEGSANLFTGSVGRTESTDFETLKCCYINSKFDFATADEIAAAFSFDKELSMIGQEMGTLVSKAAADQQFVSHHNGYIGYTNHQDSYRRGEQRNSGASLNSFHDASIRRFGDGSQCSIALKSHSSSRSAAKCTSAPSKGTAALSKKALAVKRRRHELARLSKLYAPQLPPILKNDVRRKIPLFLQNMYNSLDYMKMLNFLDTFFTSDCKYTHNYEKNALVTFSDLAPDAAPMGFELAGRGAFASLWYSLMCAAVDATLVITETEITLRSDGTAMLKSQFTNVETYLVLPEGTTPIKVLTLEERIAEDKRVQEIYSRSYNPAVLSGKNISDSGASAARGGSEATRRAISPMRNRRHDDNAAASAASASSALSQYEPDNISIGSNIDTGDTAAGNTELDSQTESMLAQRIADLILGNDHDAMRKEMVLEKKLARKAKAKVEEEAASVDGASVAKDDESTVTMIDTTTTTSELNEGSGDADGAGYKRMLGNNEVGRNPEELGTTTTSTPMVAVAVGPSSPVPPPPSAFPCGMFGPPRAVKRQGWGELRLHLNADSKVYGIDLVMKSRCSLDAPQDN